MIRTTVGSGKSVGNSTQLLSTAFSSS